MAEPPNEEPIAQAEPTANSPGYAPFGLQACPPEGQIRCAFAVMQQRSAALASATSTKASVSPLPPSLTSIHTLKSMLHFVEKGSAPSLLPILRSQQQGEILALLLGDPELELNLTELADKTSTPHPSVHREIERAEAAGLVTSRKVGNSRLVRANTTSPYYGGLAEVLTRAFGVPAVIAQALSGVTGVHEAVIYGSWAARHAGERGNRPVGDIDLLVLGQPDRDALYAALGPAEKRLGRPIQATIREPGWLESGTGSFHDTVATRPMLRLSL